MLYIGVDLGTSAVKLLLMDERFIILFQKNIRLVFHIRAGQNKIRRTGKSSHWQGSKN